MGAGNTGLLHCRGGQRDLAPHKIRRIRPAGVRPPCTRDLGRLFLGSVSGPDSNTHGCGVRDLVWGWHSADLRRWLVILSATPHHHADPVHRVGRCGGNRLELINQSGLVRDWRWGICQKGMQHLRWRGEGGCNVSSWHIATNMTAAWHVQNLGPTGLSSDAPIDMNDPNRSS